MREHVDRFCTIFHTHLEALARIPVHIMAHFFFRSLTTYHDNLRQAGEYYLTVIDPEGGMGRLFAHLYDVEDSLKVLKGINNIERVQGPIDGRSGYDARRGITDPASYRQISGSISHPSSPESDVRTRISAWNSPNARQEASPYGSRRLSDISMEFSLNQPVAYHTHPYECDIKLPPIVSPEVEEELSPVEMDAAAIMMQLSRK